MAALWAVATVAALVVGTLAAAVVGLVAAVGLLAAAAAADRAAATAGRRVAAAWEAHAYGKNKRGWDRRLYVHVFTDLFQACPNAKVARCSRARCGL